jgi:hypothetical protein
VDVVVFEVGLDLVKQAENSSTSSPGLQISFCPYGVVITAIAGGVSQALLEIPECQGRFAILPEQGVSARSVEIVDNRQGALR